jgi:ankyrin repeat protein
VSACAAQKEGHTPLIAASIGGHEGTVRAMLVAGANRDAKLSDGWFSGKSKTALVCARERGHCDARRRVERARARSQADAHRRTPREQTPSGKRPQWTYALRC